MSAGEHSSNKRGFAAMDDEKLRNIASKGGKAAHDKGTAHEFNSQEARVAGRKGGRIVSQDREHMAEIGRRGGEESGAGRRSRSSNVKSRAAAGGQSRQTS